ncbi:uncharacterized protein LOC135339666 [Halichondria panicea]|uniref:uncharacterized protein LOC135339666 n=1 Tax=Halichondria panicea TaxID=6063 RepID=UPI00312BB56A
MNAKGSHLSLYLLSPGPGHTQDHCRFFRHCLNEHNQAHQTCQSGLTSSYVAVIGGSYPTNDNQSPDHPIFCQWHALPPAHHHPTHHTSPLDRVLDVLTSSEGLPPCHGDGDVGFEGMSNDIHTLLDHLPATTERYRVMDVYWLIPAIDLLPSPSSAVSLYGALLRLVRWCHAHIHLITPLSSSDPTSSPIVCAWRDSLGGLSVCTEGDWEPPPGVIWRGHIHCTEHKTFKQATHRTISFPGFSLRLLSLDTPSTSPTPHNVLEGVGLHSWVHPTHLEVLRVVDMATVPLFWLSPLQCKLTLREASYSASCQMLQSLLTSSGDSRKAGLIVCLCTRLHDHTLPKSANKPSHQEGLEGSSTVPVNRRIKNKTTAEWVEFVQGLEDESVITEFEDKPPAPLDAYSTGPLLLVTPATLVPSNGTLSCDAWFLWKPGMIDAGSTAPEPTQVVDDEDGELLSSATSSELLNDFSERVASLTSELDMSPSDWPEVRALKTYEWIQRKMVRRIVTSDLMFGHMIAPPPREASIPLDSQDLVDVLSCFTDHGTPTTSQLSPIAMNSSSRLSKVHAPDPCLSYNSLIASTPRSKKQYHGVNYCLTEEDSSIDAKLTKIQQRYLFSERVGHCNPVVTPQPERAKQQARRMRAGSVTLNTQTEQDMRGTQSVPPEAEKTPVKRSPPHIRQHYTQARTGVSLLKSPVIKITKVQRRQLESTLHSNSSMNEEPVGAAAVSLSVSEPSAAAVSLPSVNEPSAQCSGSAGVEREAVLRRSPRHKNKWKGGTKEHGRKETLKSKLSLEVLASLKKSELHRSHPAFKRCYSKLFSISKTFLKDMAVRGAVAQKAEIRRVVELNVKNVLDFELSKYKTASRIASDIIL